jgi:hypothetical protein
MKRKRFIIEVDHIVYLKMIEVNEKLNMYFATKTPFIGYYEPNNDINDGIVIDLKFPHRGMNDKFLYNLSKTHNDELKEEKEILLTIFEERKKFAGRFNAILSWNTYYDKFSDSYKTVEKMHYARCSIASKKGIAKKIEIIKKENPNSKELINFDKKEKIKKIYNIDEVETGLHKFIDSEITRIIQKYFNENKLGIDIVINRVIKEAIEQIKTSIKEIEV